MHQSMITATSPYTRHSAKDDAVTWRFGVMVEPDAPLPVVVERFKRVEELGFDQVFVPDHIGNLYDLNQQWFDGWSLLAAAASQTDTIRIGTLVSNPILRPPAVVAKQAMTIDHLSGGRLDLGLGAGIFPFDHDAVGSAPWSPKERAGRFAEYTEIIDGILRSAGQRYSFEGQWLSARDVPTAPGSVQDPRPPVIVGGQSPTVLRVAAERADVWNTIGPMEAGYEETVEVTGRQNQLLDELSAAAGRDPASLRRSLTLFGAHDPWSSPVSFEDVVERFSAIGMTEFVIGWPPDDRLDEFERISLDVIPALRDRQL